MEVITTHLNADFDALGSMIAAQKLYPKALLVFPGSQERGLRDFFVRSAFYIVNAKRLKEIDLKEIERLIVVDTRQRSRIGAFANVLGRPGLEVHVYDHHPPSQDDFPADFECVEQKGANTTLMVKILREKGIMPTKEEATIMLLGIYEDTGAFTFASTTPEDLEAAAFLLSLGADLRTVSEVLFREMDAEQLKLLNQMVENAEHFLIKGLDVVITSASTDSYLQEAALLAQKFRALEPADALFVLLRMGERILLIARSRSPELDVGKVLASLGGGGHPTAASATLKGLTVYEIKEKLLETLAKHVRPRVVAKDIMTSPLKTISSETSLQEALEVMRRFALGVLPVVQDGKFLGLIYWEEAEKGLSHGLGQMAVREFMRINVPTVGPEASFWEVHEHLMGTNLRLLPVVEGGRLLGGITKSDLLRALDKLLPSTEVKLAKGKKRDLKHLLESKLPEKLLRLLEEIGYMAERMGYKAYLVGGFVRDLLLGKENLDVDVVVEGDGLAFAKALGERFGLVPKVHKAMGTATLRFEEGWRLDIATARIEYYPTPASPPKVEGSSLKHDLMRRDFTINALAINLLPSNFGELIDFFGGQKDIKERVIRVLHGLSFIEDPSRIFRALRFESRFGFKMDKQTEHLLKEAISLGFVQKLSGHRLLTELQLVLEEEKAPQILERMEEFGLLKVFHPKLSLTDKLKGLISQTTEVLNWYKFLYLRESATKSHVLLLVLTETLKPHERVEMVEKLGIVGPLKKLLLEERQKAQMALLRLQPSMDPWEVFEILEPFHIETLLYLMALCQDARQKLLAEFISRWRLVKPSLKGRDLLALGIPPGPEYQKILRRLLQARLREEVRDKEGELELVKAEFGDKISQDKINCKAERT